jgi:hypothetical protein
VGDEKAWEIGQPYVPHALISTGDERLRVIVIWDVTSRGLFHKAIGAAAT